jgi:hypothetical protein
MIFTLLCPQLGVTPANQLDEFLRGLQLDHSILADEAGLLGTLSSVVERLSEHLDGNVCLFRVLACHSQELKAGRLQWDQVAAGAQEVALLPLQSHGIQAERRQDRSAGNVPLGG